MIHTRTVHTHLKNNEGFPSSFHKVSKSKVLLHRTHLQSWFEMKPIDSASETSGPVHTVPFTGLPCEPWKKVHPDRLKKGNEARTIISLSNGNQSKERRLCRPSASLRSSEPPNWTPPGWSPFIQGTVPMPLFVKVWGQYRKTEMFCII